MAKSVRVKGTGYREREGTLLVAGDCSVWCTDWNGVEQNVKDVGCYVELHRRWLNTQTDLVEFSVVNSVSVFQV